MCFVAAHALFPFALQLPPMDLSRLAPEFQLLLISVCHPFPASELDRLRTACGLVARWPDFLALAERHNVAGIAYRNLRQYAAGQVPEEVLGQFREQARRSQRHALALMHEQNQIADWLGAAGLGLCPLKGPALSQRLYGDIGWRATSDLDVLTPGADLAQAERLLLDQGYRRTVPPAALAPRQRPVYQWLFHHYGYRHPERGTTVELHYLIAEPYLIPPVTTQHMLLRAKAQTLAGTTVTSLTDEDTMAFLLIHGARHNWARLKWIADIAALARGAADLKWARVDSVLVEAGWRRALGQGALLANWLLGLPVTPLAQEVIASTPAVKRLAEDSLQALLAPRDYASAPGRWRGLRHLFYLTQLNPALGYKLPLLTSVHFYYTAWRFTVWSLRRQIQPDPHSQRQ